MQWCIYCRVGQGGGLRGNTAGVGMAAVSAGVIALPAGVVMVVAIEMVGMLIALEVYAATDRVDCALYAHQQQRDDNQAGE